MLAQPITPRTDSCNVARRWGITPQLATKLQILTARVGGGGAIISIISGRRTVQEQLSLCEDLFGTGRPCAAPEGSRHVQCPATAVDLRVDGVDLKRLGAIWEELGGRWGGRFNDPNHFDLG